MSKIGLKLFKSWGSCTLGIRAMNEALPPLEKLPWAWNSHRKRRISGFMICQKCLMNLKLSPSGPGLFSLPQSHTPLLISSSVKMSTSKLFSCCPINKFNFYFPGEIHLPLWLILDGSVSSQPKLNAILDSRSQSGCHTKDLLEWKYF